MTYKMNSKPTPKPSRAVLLFAGSLLLGTAILGCGKKELPVSGETPSDPVNTEAAQPSGTEGQAIKETPPAAGGSEIAIQVNDHVVTQAEFAQELEQETARAEQQLAAFGQSPEHVKQYLAQNHPQMVEQLIERTVGRILVEDYVTQATVAVTPDEIERKWTEIKAQFPDEEALKKAAEGQGMTLAELRDKVSLQLKAEKLFAQELGETEATDAEVRAFYDSQPDRFQQPAQVRARHLLLSEKEGAKEAIDALHKRIVAGEDFAALATEHSECPSGKQGGDLGFFDKEQMVPAFSDAAFSMKVGEVSAPVQTQFGYHIIKVEERRDAKKAEFAEVQEGIKKHLDEEKGRVKEEEFIDRLKKAAKITINVETPPVEQPALIPNAIPDAAPDSLPDTNVGADPGAASEAAP